MKAKSFQLIRKFIALSAILAAWELAAMAASGAGGTVASLMPTWEYVLTVDLPGFATFQNGILTNTASDYMIALLVLLKHSAITIGRVLLGLIIGAALGIGMGLAISFNKTVRRIIYPTIRVIRNVPLLALVALFLVWFGGSEKGIIIYIVFALWIIYCTSTIEATTTVDSTRIAFARTLGAGNREIFFDVTIPMIVPNIMDATKVALGVAWAVALGSEFLAAQSGLGRLMIISQTYLNTGRMLVILILFVILTLIFSGIVTLLSKRILRWMP